MWFFKSKYLITDGQSEIGLQYDPKKYMDVTFSGKLDEDSVKYQDTALKLLKKV